MHKTKLTIMQEFLDGLDSIADDVEFSIKSGEDPTSAFDRATSELDLLVGSTSFELEGGAQ